MKFRILSVTDQALYDANVAVTIDYTDFAALAAGATGSINLAPYQGLNTSGASDAGTTLPIGNRVKLVGFQCTAGFVFSDAGTTCLITVGDSASAARYMASTQFIAGSQVTFGVGTGTAYALLAASAIIAAVTASTNANTATAGSVTFYLAIADMNTFVTP